ncbi:MAG: response regulator [Oligoflexales bacterium]|nr:response regulator [Oligoflexales bacterium]
MKPVVFYIDDEAYALTAFEMNVPEDWEVHTYSSPLLAINDFKKFKPWVVVADQLMPEIKGVDLLSIASVHLPNAIRILTTAYSGEELLIQSLEKAKVYGYITKPWSENVIENTVGGAIELYKAKTERDRYYAQLEENNRKLKETHTKLEKYLNELRAWLPPMIYHMVVNNIEIPETGCFVGITYDIISSSKIRDVKVDGKPLKSVVAALFAQSVMKYGGFIECHASDYAFAHFGLLKSSAEACNQAMSAANEFRMSLRSLAEVYELDFECGIALHSGENVKQMINKVTVIKDDLLLNHKWYETESSEVDLLHRLEKLVHGLPGSNIIVSKSFYNSISPRYQKKFEYLGNYLAKGQEYPIGIYLSKSDMVKAIDIKQFIVRNLIDDKGKKMLEKVVG